MGLELDTASLMGPSSSVGLLMISSKAVGYWYKRVETLSVGIGKAVN